MIINKYNIMLLIISYWKLMNKYSKNTFIILNLIYKKKSFLNLREEYKLCFTYNH